MMALAMAGTARTLSFGDQLEDWMNDQGVSWAGLERRIEEADRRGRIKWPEHKPGPRSASHLNMVARHTQGRRVPTARARLTPNLMAAVATVMGVAPETFVEWRLWETRRCLDPDVVGLERAVAVHESVAPLIEQALDGARSPAPSRRPPRGQARRPTRKATGA